MLLLWQVWLVYVMIKAYFWILIQWAVSMTFFMIVTIFFSSSVKQARWGAQAFVISLDPIWSYCLSWSYLYDIIEMGLANLAEEFQISNRDQSKWRRGILQRKHWQQLRAIFCANLEEAHGPIGVSWGVLMHVKIETLDLVSTVHNWMIVNVVFPLNLLFVCSLGSTSVNQICTVYFSVCYLDAELFDVVTF